MTKPKPMTKTIEELAVILHDKYEEEAIKAGWNTQEKCKVSFDDLPEENKKVMCEMGKLVRDLLAEHAEAVRQEQIEKDIKDLDGFKDYIASTKPCTNSKPRHQ